MIEQSTVLDQIIERAMKDDAFRAEVLENPRKVLVRDYKLRLPNTFNVRAVEDPPDTMTIHLPAKQHTGRELDDAELETAARAQTQQIKILWTGICSSVGPCG